MRLRSITLKDNSLFNENKKGFYCLGIFSLPYLRDYFGASEITVSIDNFYWHPVSLIKINLYYDKDIKL